MRECIYCGRSLEKGEKCTCPMSVANRKSKEQAEPEPQKDNRSEEKARKKARKEETKRQKKAERERMRANRSHVNCNNLFAEFKTLLIRFIKSPVETVMNPGEMSKAVIICFSVIEGIIGGLCVYSIITGAVRGPFKFLGNMMGFGGENGYGVLKGWLMSALSGGISGIVIFFIYSGVFYIINRWIFKQFTPYWDFIKRFAFVAIPMSAVGVLGVILGLFSLFTFIILLLSGAAGSILITYEILRSVWYSKSPTKIIYTMMLGIFVFLTVLMNFIRLI